MTLINIEYGSLASSDIMNKNFNYLEKKISSNLESVNTSISSLMSNIVTINTRLVDLTQELEDTVSLVESKIDELKNKAQICINKATMLPNWAGCFNLTTLDDYEVESNGYVLIISNSISDANIKINEIDLVVKADAFTALPVKKADILTVINGVDKVYFLPAQEVYIDEN